MPGREGAENLKGIGSDACEFDRLPDGAVLSRNLVQFCSRAKRNTIIVHVDQVMHIEFPFRPLLSLPALASDTCMAEDSS